MTEDRAVLRKKMLQQLVELKSSTIAELEHRGYEVRGKTTTQIRQILKRHPTKPPTFSRKTAIDQAFLTSPDLCVSIAIASSRNDC
jgi:hypothetical protein